MARFYHRDFPQYWRKGSTVFLAFFWCFGLVCGILTYFSADTVFSSLMRRTLTGSVSIVSLLGVPILPFLFSAFAVFISEPRLLVLVSFGKAFLFSFVSLGVIQAFGSAGWLIRWLLMFSNCMSVPVLYWFWQRHISAVRPVKIMDLVCFLCIGLLIGSIDYCMISPFLARLIEI